MEKINFIDKVFNKLQEQIDQSMGSVHAEKVEKVCYYFQNGNGVKIQGWKKSDANHGKKITITNSEQVEIIHLEYELKKMDDIEIIVMNVDSNVKSGQTSSIRYEKGTGKFEDANIDGYEAISKNGLIQENNQNHITFTYCHDGLDKIAVCGSKIEGCVISDKASDALEYKEHIEQELDVVYSVIRNLNSTVEKQHSSLKIKPIKHN